MNKTYCIIGTGRQGTAAAYDLLMYADISSLLLLDNNQESIDKCMYKINSLKSKASIAAHIIDFNDYRLANRICFNDCPWFEFVFKRTTFYVPYVINENV